MDNASSHSSGEKRIARSLLSSAWASVVFPEPGKPHTRINLPGLCTKEIIPERVRPTRASPSQTDHASTLPWVVGQFESLSSDLPLFGRNGTPVRSRYAGHFRYADFPLLACEQGRQRQDLVCRRKSEQHLSKDQVAGSRFKCSLPHEQRTSNTGTNVRPYRVSEYRTRRGKPCS
jgi:hypothetical protein